MALLEQEVQERGELVGGLTARAGPGDDPLLTADPEELARLGRGLSGRGATHGDERTQAPLLPGTFRCQTFAHSRLRRGARYSGRLPNAVVGDPAGSRGTAAL